MQRRDKVQAIGLADQIKSICPVIKDFPKKGVDFIDIFPLWNTPGVIQSINLELWSLVESHVALIESRAFLFASALTKTGRKIVPIRKKGKLPPRSYTDLVKVSYQKEYGEDILEYRISDFIGVNNITIVDDILATGGTMLTLAESLKHQGIKVDKFISLIEIESLGARTQLEKIAPVISFAQV